MLKKVTLASALLISTVSYAASQGESAIIKDSDQTITLAMDKNSWSYAAAATKGMSKVREFYDMGAAGVQQLDYVVNCTNGKLALASFKVLTAMSSDIGAATEPSIGSVSFYKPVIQHDLNIVDNVCGSRMASTAAAQISQ
jgi:hypothetical protein